MTLDARSSTGHAALSRREPLHLDEATFQQLLELQGPSLGLWRAAEVAALREPLYEPPVLDLGCGDGLVTSMVLPRVAIGVDPDPRAIRRAKQRGIYDQLLALPVQAAPVAPGSLGSVISNSVLEHIPPIADVLAAIARMLRPGGRLIFTAPTEAFGQMLVLPFTRYGARRNRRFDHINVWSVEEWSRCLDRVGLVIEAIRSYMRRPLVRVWDALELMQQLWVGRRRVVSMVWERIPPTWMRALARRAAALDLSAPPPGGGRLIVARKR